MAAKNYKVGEAIQVEYRSKKSQTGLTVLMDVFDETGTLDVILSVPAMSEPNSDGVYVDSFTPDAQGNWMVYVYETGKANDKVIRKYSVGGYDLDTVGQTVDAIAADTGSPPMIG